MTFYEDFNMFVIVKVLIYTTSTSATAVYVCIVVCPADGSIPPDHL